jgi:uncharacterized protein YdeI (YjbR/CyaY-like superfamily)
VIVPKSAADFRAWLRANHRRETEVWVCFWKKHTGRPSLTWQESVDEALCVGWIDGIRKRRDDESFIQRFTPRRKGSNWSLINIARVEALTKEGRMLPAGLAAFALRSEARSGIYAFERDHPAQFTSTEEKAFRARKKAWAFFESQPPGHRKIVLHWLASAKRAETRTKRFETLVADSAQGLRIASQRPTASPRSARKPARATGSRAASAAPRAKPRPTQAPRPARHR